MYLIYKANIFEIVFAPLGALIWIILIYSWIKDIIIFQTEKTPTQVTVETIEKGNFSSKHVLFKNVYTYGTMVYSIKTSSRKNTEISSSVDEAIYPISDSPVLESGQKKAVVFVEKSINNHDSDSFAENYTMATGSIDIEWYIKRVDISTLSPEKISLFEENGIKVDNQIYMVEEMSPWSKMESRGKMFMFIWLLILLASFFLVFSLWKTNKKSWNAA